MSQRYQKIIRSHASSDGDGVKIQRVALFNDTASDPFLMIDELRSDNPDDYIGGFPPHPHRGMETLTYLLQGALEHKDHLGNRGLINSGGAQWMSAGRGIIHSEMPSREMDALHGFQLWINLPASEKMKTPGYRDVAADEILHQTAACGAQLKLIAGHWIIDGENYVAPLATIAANAGIADIHLDAGQQLTLPITAGHSAMAYVYQGLLTDMNHSQSLVMFDTAEEIITLNATSDTDLLLLTGRPLREPIAHYGPFVMNSVEEIEQAIADYNAGRFGQ
jgi:redox-sensitive bicupin YhaK (pirin superfamily)